MFMRIDSPARLPELISQPGTLTTASRMVLGGGSIVQTHEPQVAMIIANSPNLADLTLSLEGMPDASVARLVDGLGPRRKLKSLYVHGAAGDEAGSAVARAILVLPRLETLVLSNSSVSDKGLRDVARRLPGCHKLRRLWLAEIMASDESFAECIRSLPTGLRELELFGSGAAGAGAAAALADMLPTMSNLQCLLIGRTGMREGDVLRVLRSRSRSLRQLDLGGLNATSLPDDLPRSFPRLTKFSLRESGISDEHCRVLGSWIGQGTLRQLDLRYNPGLTSAGAEMIASGVTRKSRLRLMDLAHSSCGDDGLIALAGAFSAHDHPPTIDLSSTNVSAEVLRLQVSESSSLFVNLSSCQGIGELIRFPCALSAACAIHRLRDN